MTEQPTEGVLALRDAALWHTRCERRRRNVADQTAILERTVHRLRRYHLKRCTSRSARDAFRPTRRGETPDVTIVAPSLSAAIDEAVRFNGRQVAA